MKHFIFSALLISLSAGAQTSGFSSNNGTSAPETFSSPGTGVNDVTPRTSTTNSIPAAGFSGTADIGTGGQPDPMTDTPTGVSPSVLNTSPNPTPDANASRTFDDTLSTGQGAPTRNTLDLGPYNSGSSDPVERQAEEENP